MATTGKRDHPTNREREKLACRKLLRHIRYLTGRGGTGRVQMEVSINAGYIEGADGGPREADRYRSH
jgi:hypothetical protein